MSDDGKMIRQYCVAHGHPSCQACHFAQLDRLKALETERDTLRTAVTDLLAALEACVEHFRDHDSVGGRRLTEVNVFPECGREFPKITDEMAALIADVKKKTGI